MNLVKIKPKKQKAKHRLRRMVLSHKMSNPRIINPQNIFLHANYKPKVANFGLSTLLIEITCTTLQNSQNHANSGIYGNQVRL